MVCKEAVVPSSIFFPHTPSHIHRDSVLEENEQKDAVLVNDIRPETAAMLTLNVSSLTFLFLLASRQTLFFLCLLLMAKTIKNRREVELMCFQFERYILTDSAFRVMSSRSRRK